MGLVHNTPKCTMLVFVAEQPRTGMWTVWGNSRASRSAAAKIPSSTIFSRPSTVCPLGEAEVHVVFIFGCFDLIKRLKEYSQKRETKYTFPPFD